MTNEIHAPSPARYQLETDSDDRTGGAWNVVVDRVENRVVCQVIVEDKDAALIVALLNAHADVTPVVEVVRQLLPYVEDVQDAGPEGQGWKSDKLSALIATAEGICRSHAERPLSTDF